MSVRRTGNWQGISRLMGALPETLEEAKQLSLKRWSLKAEGLAKGHMSAQDLGWTPLSVKTVAAKLRRGESYLAVQRPVVVSAGECLCCGGNIDDCLDVVTIISSPRRPQPEHAAKAKRGSSCQKCPT